MRWPVSLVTVPRLLFTGRWSTAGRLLFTSPGTAHRPLLTGRWMTVLRLLFTGQPIPVPRLLLTSGRGTISLPLFTCWKGGSNECFRPYPDHSPHIHRRVGGGDRAGHPARGDRRAGCRLPQGLAGRIVNETGSLRRFVNVYVGEEDVRFAQGLDTQGPGRRPCLGHSGGGGRLTGGHGHLVGRAFAQSEPWCPCALAGGLVPVAEFAPG